MKAALDRLKAVYAYRVWRHYTDARGGVLAGGVAYFAFFSLFPALTLGFAIFGFVLRDHQSLYHDIVHSVSTTLPGVVKDSEHPDGVIDASQPPTPNALTITGLVSLVVLVISGLGWLAALREGIRTMFGRPRLKGPVMNRVRDLGVLALLGGAILVSAVLSALANTATDQVLEWMGVSSGSTLGQIALPIVGFLVVYVVDVGIFLVLLRLLPGVPMPWSDLMQAALVGAFGAGVLKLAVAYGVVGSSSNPVLASIALVVGLLIVVNLLCRVALFSAAWAAVGAGAVLADSGPVPSREGVEADRAAQTPVSSARRLPHPAQMEPAFGQRSADRTAIAAGAVMGAVGAVGMGALRRASSAMVSSLRRG